MQNVPLRVALEDNLKRARTNDVATGVGGSCSCCYLGCFCTVRGGMISKPKLVARFEMFVRGEWQALLEAGQDRASKVATTKSRRRALSED